MILLLFSLRLENRWTSKLEHLITLFENKRTPQLENRRTLSLRTRYHLSWKTSLFGKPKNTSVEEHPWNLSEKILWPQFLRQKITPKNAYCVTFADLWHGTGLEFFILKKKCFAGTPKWIFPLSPLPIFFCQKTSCVFKGCLPPAFPQHSIWKGSQRDNLIIANVPQIWSQMSR